MQECSVEKKENENKIYFQKQIIFSPTNFITQQLNWFRQKQPNKNEKN